MSDEQKDTALKIGAFIAIIPVAILIFGKMVKGVSGAIGAYSRFSKNVQMAGGMVSFRRHFSYGDPASF